LNVVRGDDVQPFPCQLYPGKCVRGDGKQPSLIPGHGFPPPDRRRNKDDAVDIGRIVPGHGDDGHSAPHTLSQYVERNAWVTFANYLYEAGKVVRVGLGTRPKSTSRRAAETTLVI